MRVHPSVFAPATLKWQLPAALGIIVLLLAAAVLRRPDSEVVVQAVATEKKIEVIVARSKIEAGQPLEKADVALEMRPVSTLPADAISSLDSLKNKVAAGPIPAGYPLALALLADPVVTMPEAPHIDSNLPIESPVDLLLKEIEGETVALPVVFNATPPQRGARMAVTISNTKGGSIIVAEECWVANNANGREAVVRLNPAKALILQAAKAYGTFGFIELPTEGPSPYAGSAVTSLEEVRERLEGKSPETITKAASTDSNRRMRGYAWIPGEGIRYGIDSDGQIKVVGADEMNQ